MLKGVRIAVFLTIIFLAGFSVASAAPVLSSDPADSSSAAIGTDINYSWMPASSRDNCITFLPPGASSWDNWICPGGSQGNYTKNTAGLTAGFFKAIAATKKCRFLFWSCSWEYSNQVSTQLFAPATQIVKADIKVNGSDKDITVNYRSEVDVKWTSENAGSCQITPCTLSFPNVCDTTSGQEKAVVDTTTDFIATCFSPNGSEVSAPDVVRVNAVVPPRPINNPPRVTSLSPQQQDYCASPLGWTLSWEFSDPDAGSYQSAYQIKISDADTGKEILSRLYYSSSNSFAVPSGALSFGKSYSWKIKVWDDKLKTAEADGENFMTLSHRPPQSDFSWLPQLSKPAAGEKINFSDSTYFYDSSASGRKWLWSFPAGMAVLSPLNESSAAAKAAQSGVYNVVLNAADSDNLTCAVTKPVGVGRTPPSVKEIFPR